MPNYKIYHNPRCSKSRQTLQILKNAGVEIEVVLYLENHPSKKEIKELARLLNMRLIEFTRIKEGEFRASGLSKDASDDEIVDLLAKMPKLIERPIVIKDGNQAVIGRPPENVNQLL